MYDPSRFWVIREFEGQMVWNPAPVRGNATISATIDYEETPDGIPILKQITRRIKHLKDSEPVSHRFDFDLREDNVRESEFTLAAFGLPEPPARSWSLPLFLGDVRCGSCLPRVIDLASSACPGGRHGITTSGEEECSFNGLIFPAGHWTTLPVLTVNSGGSSDINVWGSQNCGNQRRPEEPVV